MSKILYRYQEGVPMVNSRLTHGEKVMDEFGNIYQIEVMAGIPSPELIMPVDQILEIPDAMLAKGDADVGDIIPWLRSRRARRSMFSVFKLLADSQIKKNEAHESRQAKR